MRKVELLAPCGNYESFLAAVNAGADAVYLAGEKFGARAYAENFSAEALVHVIRLAQLWDVKVYMTVNTLVKEEEFAELYDYMLPYVEAGLNGAIIQDLGVFSFFQQCFPSLELHASTQMTVTSVYGANYLKQKGCVRIVPSRELSLSEIYEMKKQTGLEIEAFIHGAMCYCYSGKCLMSSFIGGRSGNRGRCAQPCRLPYIIHNQEQYYLSLKDMNTLLDIPKLIDSGIDSFKIEGRMKKPEYVAGVVSIYRKYIDLYMKNPDKYDIAEKDIKLLHQLYIRSETGNGYYHKARGKDMITLRQPGYQGTDEVILEGLRNQYVRKLPDIPVAMEFVLRKDKPIFGKVTADMPIFFHKSTQRKESVQTVFSLRGEILGKAKNRAATENEIIKQMTKLGNTPFVAKSCDVIMDQDIFAPVKILNEFRRELMNQFMLHMIRNIHGIEAHSSDDTLAAADKELEVYQCKDSQDNFLMAKDNLLIASTMNAKQFVAAHSSGADVIFIDCDYLYQKFSKENLGKQCFGIKNFKQLISLMFQIDYNDIQEKTVGIKMPEIIRLQDEKYLQFVSELIVLMPDAISCNGVDSLGYIKESGYTGAIYGDAGLYAWNKNAINFMTKDLERVTVALEQNSGEIRTLCHNLKEKRGSLDVVVYGKAPLMVTANCLKLTTDQCDHNRLYALSMKDRIKHNFSVYTNCIHCYNIIYNYIPTSLHESVWMLLEDGITGFRLDFFDETKEQTEMVVQTFKRLISSKTGKKNCDRITLPFQTTTGHIKRGVQ